ncbi:hypothetical protein [Amycolatopsis pigmentata]|uniref:Excreted virulence factor EspC (Type VII ESX diderm) n=1 Tax=Amycolatopsis pigmentata TaxID=450801 RepID=A0ABW5FMJ0_9PSEU
MSSPGFQVHLPTVDSAGQAAGPIGAAISELGSEVRAASNVQPAPDGLTIGATLLAVTPLWQRHLMALGNEVKQDGDNLTAAQENYARADTNAVQSLSELQSLLDST